MKFCYRFHSAVSCCTGKQLWRDDCWSQQCITSYDTTIERVGEITADNCVMERHLVLYCQGEHSFVLASLAFLMFFSSVVCASKTCNLWSYMWASWNHWLCSGHSCMFPPHVWRESLCRWWTGKLDPVWVIMIQNRGHLHDFLHQSLNLNAPGNWQTLGISPWMLKNMMWLYDSIQLHCRWIPLPQRTCWVNEARCVLQKESGRMCWVMPIK